MAAPEVHHLIDNPFIRSAIIIGITFLITAISRPVIDRFVRRIVPDERHEAKAEKRKREETLITIYRKIFIFIVWVLATATVLPLFHINLAGLATGAGFLSVIIGFGAQSTVKDYIAGIYIIAENQYRVGDIVTLSGGTTGMNGTSGVVEDITLRITKLRDLDGTLNVVRNGEASIITNRTFKYSSVVVDLSVSYESDIDHVEKVINQVGKDMLETDRWNKVITEPISFLWIDSFNEDGVKMRTVGRVQPAAQWNVAGEFRRRIMKAFVAEGISLAVPYRAIEFHERPPANLTNAMSVASSKPK